MQLQAAIRTRRMIRRFDGDRQVPDEVIRRLAELALHAPSAGFSQGWDFVVLREDADRARYWSATTTPDAEPDAWLRGVSAAPTLILCLGNENAYLRRYAEPDKQPTGLAQNTWPAPYWHIDTAMAAMLMLLGAHDEGLGALFFAVPTDHQDAVRESFGIPADRVLVGAIALGYARSTDPSGSTRRRTKRRVEDTFHAGRYGEPFTA